MLKNELIERLQSIDGNLAVLLDDTELGYIELKDVRLNRMHPSISEPNEYVTDSEFEREIGYNTFFHDNYKKDVRKCILLSL